MPPRVSTPSSRNARRSGAGNKEELSERYSDDLLRHVLSSVKTIAMVGASANPARPSNGVMRFLQSRGFSLSAIFKLLKSPPGEDTSGG